MIPLSPHLDDIDFDALLALARARLPALAPEWTDYNHHDPGITLVELLAWVANSQVYSLARNRLDERLAMARLLAATPQRCDPGARHGLSARPAAGRAAHRARYRPDARDDVGAAPRNHA